MKDITISGIIFDYIVKNFIPSMDKWFRPILYDGRNYLSIMRLNYMMDVIVYSLWDQN